MPNFFYEHFHGFIDALHSDKFNYMLVRGMAMPYLFLIIITGAQFLSCNNDKSVKADILLVKNDSGNNPVKQSGKQIKVNDSVQVISSKQIIGTWQTTGKELLTLDITTGSIFYREHHESHTYKIKSDSIYISYPGFILSGKIYLIKDTLIIATKNGEIKDIRIKK